MKDLKPVVKRNWHTEGHKNIIVYNPPNASEYALAIALFKNENKDRRYEYFDHATAFGMEPDHVSCCLVIGINITSHWEVI